MDTEQPLNTMTTESPFLGGPPPPKQPVWIRLCHRYGYDDADVESLYHSYIFNLQRTSVKWMMVLLAILTLSLAVINFIYFSNASVENIANMALCVVFVVLLVFLHTKYMTTTQLPITCYLIVFLCLCFGVISMPVNYQDQPRWQYTPVDGVWRVFYVIIAVYAFLPLRIPMGLLVGLSLPAAHTALSILFANSHPALLWRQITANIIMYIAANIVGIYIHDRREHAQRKVFHNIRACVAGRMHLEDEKEKQEKLLQSLLPLQLVSEMRNDMKHPRDDVLLQNVYAQRHDQVSILYADIEGLAALQCQLSPQQLVSVVNELVDRFDQLAYDNHCLRVRVEGSSYFSVCGLPERRPDHAKCCVELGLDIIDTIRHLHDTADVQLRVCVGVHSGSALSGVVGTKKWQFEVWSEDVKVAKDMQVNGSPGRVHVTEATVDHLHGEFGVELSDSQSPLLREREQEGYFILADQYRKQHSKHVRSHHNSNKGIKIGLPDTLYNRLVDTLKFTSDVPLANIMQVNREEKDSKKMLADKVVRPFKRNDKVPSERVEQYMQTVIDTKNIDNLKREQINFVSLKFKHSSIERRYLRQEDVSFPTTMFLSLIFLVLTSAMQALILPRTLLLLVLFIITFCWIAVILIIILGSRLKCIGCDLQQAAIIRLLVITVTVLLIYSVSQVNVFCCHGGVIFSNNITLDVSLIAFNNHYHLKCDVPQYIYLSGILAFFLVTLFLKLSAIAKLLLMLVMAVGYGVIIAYTHRPLFVGSDTRISPVVPTDVVGILALLQCLVMLFVFAREFEWTLRLGFLWKDQAREEREEILDMQLVNHRILGNMLPNHVIHHYLDPLNREHVELYVKPYNRVGVVVASIPNFSELYQQLEGSERTIECIKVLNDIIADFDEVLNSERFRGIEKIRTMGPCYMVAAGLLPEHAINETDQCVAYYLTALVEFVFALREKLEINNTSYGTRFQLRVGINLGPVAAGVVGAKKPQFEMWGLAVDLANAMEANGQGGQIQVTDEVFRYLRDRYQFQCRGAIKLPGLREVLAYYVTGRVANYKPETQLIDSFSETRLDYIPREMNTSITLASLGSSDRIRLLESQDTANSSPRNLLVRDGSVRSNLSASSSVGGPFASIIQSGMRPRLSSEESPLMSKAAMTPPGSLSRKRRNSGGKEPMRKPSSSSMTNFLSPPQPDPTHLRMESPDLPMVHYKNTYIHGSGSLGRGESLGAQPSGATQLTQSQILGLGMETPPPVLTSKPPTPASPDSTHEFGTPSTGRSSVASVISVKARESPQTPRLPHGSHSEPVLYGFNGTSNMLVNYPSTKSASNLGAISNNPYSLPCIDEASESKSNTSDGAISSPNSADLSTLGREFNELEKIMQEFDHDKVAKVASSHSLDSNGIFNELEQANGASTRSGDSPSGTSNHYFIPPLSPLHPPMSASSVQVKSAPLVSLLPRQHSFPEQHHPGPSYQKQFSAPAVTNLPSFGAKYEGLSGIRTSPNGVTARTPPEDDLQIPAFQVAIGKYDSSTMGTKYDNASSTLGTKYDNASSTGTGTHYDSGSLSSGGSGRKDSLNIPRLKLLNGKTHKNSPPPLPPPPPDEFFASNYSHPYKAGYAKMLGRQTTEAEQSSKFPPVNDLGGASSKHEKVPDKQKNNKMSKSNGNTHLKLPEKSSKSKEKQKHKLKYSKMNDPSYNIVTGEPIFATPQAVKPGSSSQSHADKKSGSKISQRKPEKKVKKGNESNAKEEQLSPTARHSLMRGPPRLSRSLEQLPSDLEDSVSECSSVTDSPRIRDSRHKPRHSTTDQLLPLVPLSKHHLLPDNISLSSIGSSEMSKSDPMLNYESSSTAYESEYDNYRPGMASDEDYFVPDAISDVDIDIFEELNVDDVEVSDKYSLDMPMPILHKIVTDV